MNERILTLLLASFAVACGDDSPADDGDSSGGSEDAADDADDDDSATNPTTVDDSGSDDDADSSTGGDDTTGTDEDSSSGAGSSDDTGGEPVEPTILPLPLSATAPDQLFTAAFADDDNVFAVGVVDDVLGPEANRSSVVVKLTSAGALDESFGDGGVVVLDLADGGTQESVRGVVVQSSGRVVVAGVVEHDPTAPELLATDTDIVMFALDPETGALDESFGDEGVRIFDVNDAVLDVDGMGNPVLLGRDALFSLAVDGDDELLLHGATRNGGVDRTDTDWLAIRTDPDGQLVDGFADGGMFTLDIDEANGSARVGRFLPDGSILCAGYAATLSSGDVTSPVVYKLTADGELDDSFGVLGIYHEVVLTAAGEAYDTAIHGDGFVTTGYGRNDPDAPLDVLSLRLTGDGELDPAYGDNGAAVIDVAGLTDQARTVLVLSDDRVVLLGNSQAVEAEADALVAVLTPDGQLDDGFASEGALVFDIGGNNDTLNGGVISPDGSHLFMVARKGYTNDFPQTEDENQDAAVVLLPLQR